MTIKLCDWCGEPAVENNELCQKCLDAKARVEAGALIPVPSKQEKKNLPATVATEILVLIGKALATLSLGIALVVTGLLGLCSAIATATSIFYNPFMALMPLVFTVLMYFLARFLWKMISMMHETPPRRITVKDNPRIEKHDD